MMQLELLLIPIGVVIGLFLSVFFFNTVYRKFYPAAIPMPDLTEVVVEKKMYLPQPPSYSTVAPGLPSYNEVFSLNIKPTFLVKETHCESKG